MILRIDLQLFAGGPAEGKTEKATPKRRREAREKGQVLQSREMSTALVLMSVFVAIRVFGRNIYIVLAKYIKKVLTEYPKIEDLYMPDVIVRVFIDGVLVFLRAVGPVFAIALLTGLIVEYAQVGFIFTLETLKPRFDKINPINGFKRLFSLRGAVELIKSILKIVIIGYISYSYLNGKAYVILSLMNMELIRTASFIAVTSLNLAIRICVALIILGVLDYLYQWWEFEKSLMMSKEEIKEEYKQTEGNPEIKSKIKQRQRQISMLRMMQEIPKADVVITNPTHYACALKYDANESPAPVLVAKGQDYIAARIKEIAKENGVEIVENKQLARTIFETVEIGEAIPPELYQAVAEVLAFVYSLKGKDKAI